MAREILFRGKRKDNGEWVEGYYVKSLWLETKQKLDVIIPTLNAFHFNSVTSWHSVDASTVGQYTGLVDKNGQKIFEGDIVRLVNEEYTVRFGIAGFELLRKVVSVPIGTWYGTDAIGDDGTLFEVIGNIHDSPELLEGGQ